MICFCYSPSFFSFKGPLPPVYIVILILTISRLTYEDQRQNKREAFYFKLKQITIFIRCTAKKKVIYADRAIRDEKKLILPFLSLNFYTI